jgi:two-component system nitrate/nitrite response regulator NarL
MTDNDQEISILLADDHTIFREGLKTLLSRNPVFRVVGEACDGDEVIACIAETRPNVLLLDYSMPKVDGIEVLNSLKKSDHLSKMQVIFLSGALEGQEIIDAFELGASGVVLKDAATSVLLDCISAVLAGRYWIGMQGYDTIEEVLKQHRSSEKKTPKKYGLTSREMEVLKAAVSGLSNKDIANRFSISEQTVKHHITNIFDKLGVYNRLELTLFALHHKLV